MSRLASLSKEWDFHFNSMISNKDLASENHWNRKSLKDNLTTHFLSMEFIEVQNYSIFQTYEENFKAKNIDMKVPKSTKGLNMKNVHIIFYCNYSRTRISWRTLSKFKKR